MRFSKTVHRVGLPFAAALALSHSLILAAPGELPKTHGWIEARTEHFAIYSNAGEGRVRNIATQLERFRQALGRITRGFELDAQVPTSTFVFKNDSTYEPYKRTPDGKILNVSGYFQSRPFRNTIALDASAGNEPLRVVYHEFFHAVMHNTLGSLPLWMNEGMAEYFSTFKDRAGSAVVEVGHPIEEHLAWLDRHGWIDWNEFFRTTADSPTYNESSRQGSFYAQSWLLVHYLNADDERSVQLGRYLDLLRAGRDEDEAFVAAFGAGKAALGARVEKYRESGSGYVWWDFGEEHGDVDVAMRDLEAAEVLFRLGELLAQTGQEQSAAEHLAAARAEGWPEAPIQRALGAAALYAGDDAAAEAALRRAVEAGDDSAEPYVLLGELIMNRFFGTAASRRQARETPHPVAEARRLFRQGLDRQPGHFETLVSLSRTYLYGSDDPGPGIDAIEQARTVRPLDLDMLQVQAALTARGGDVAKAFEIVRRDIAPKHAGLGHDAVQLVTDAAMAVAFERIEADDRAGALEVLGAVLERVPDDTLRARVRELHEVVASGGRIILDPGDDGSGNEETPVGLAVAEYNEGIRLLNAGRQEEALAKLDAVARDCVEPDLCATAKENAAQLRRLIDNNRFVETVNSAIEQANRGDRKAAVDILRELEATVEDPEKLRNVQDLLRQLGARVAKERN